ncbi:hypothetical protein SOCE26_024080 [Sorangium cellulosum]|uniref:Uncharacterized protein n=1 Tax=Sorangium cellulosum TaxID=56 RepID=A0A2L0ENW8_SORCE|nr:hypothetical protein [Sorangium cellulosum]AUX41004.1 hypothetical protein SOCE26_024080 [Sorangium cellulosum]
MSEGKYAILYVPDESGGKSSYLRIGATEDDPFTWRDYTDGNRVTTTRGDKIEVIGGNYKLDVMGRRDFKSGSEVEGDARLKEKSMTFRGASDDVEPGTRRLDVVRGPRGGKMLREKAAKGKVHSTYHGDVKEYHYGSKITSITGWDRPPRNLDEIDPKDPKGPVMGENPEITDRTWAKSIKSYTGSEKLPVPTIMKVSWAELMDSETHATSMADRTYVKGPSTSTMEADSITSSTTVAGTMKDTTEANRIESSTEAGKIVTYTKADSEDEKHGDANSLTIGNSLTTVVGIEATVNVGVVDEVVVGAMVEMTFGVEATFVAPLTAEMTVGRQVSVNVGTTTENTVGPSIELGPSKTKITLDRNTTAPARTHISGVHLIS